MPDTQPSDLSLTDLYRELRNVFVYATARCNQSCRTCFLAGIEKTGPSDIPPDAFQQILSETRRLGAIRLSILGGEPTCSPFFFDYLRIARDSGFPELRLDTNGQFAAELLDRPEMRMLDLVSFSMDGTRQQTCCSVRIGCDFDLLTSNIRAAVRKGLTTRVTMTVNAANVDELPEMVSRMREWGVPVLCLHLITAEGRAKAAPELALKPVAWMKLCEEVIPRLAGNGVSIRVPPRYIKREQLSQLGPDVRCRMFRYMNVTPDGSIYGCPLIIVERKPLARLTKDGHLLLISLPSNWRRTSQGVACPVLDSRERKDCEEANVVPLCVSYRKQYD